MTSRLLTYWYSGATFPLPLTELPNAMPEMMKKWFSFQPSVDEEMKQMFETDLINYKSFQPTTPQESLSLVLLLDQIPRNIYRNTPKSFSFDDEAIKVTLNSIEKKWDLDLKHPLMSTFLYMPLMHSEQLEMHVLAVQKFQELVNSAPEVYKKTAENFLKFELEHKEIIDEFGRYPHRNEVLGRESTAAEVEYLASKGDMFGVSKKK